MRRQKLPNSLEAIPDSQTDVIGGRQNYPSGRNDPPKANFFMMDKTAMDKSRFARFLLLTHLMTDRGAEREREVSPTSVVAPAEAEQSLMTTEVIYLCRIRVYRGRGAGT